MGLPGSALYVGKVMHQRLRPRRHRLSYGMFSLLLDVDRVAELSRSLLFFSHNRFNLFSFHDGDHGDGSGKPLRAHVERQLERAGIGGVDGPILLLSMPRILGYAFNPLSVYFCHDRDGRTRAILYEVNNTFGQRHSYLIPVDEPDRVIRQACTKDFYVSPFIGMAMDYAFRVAPPGETLALHITASDADGPLMIAAYSASRRQLTDSSLARAFLAFPLLTLKVVAGIHWEALRLWLKGVRLHPRPAPPDEAVTVVPALHRSGHGKTKI